MNGSMDLCIEEKEFIKTKKKAAEDYSNEYMDGEKQNPGDVAMVWQDMKIQVDEEDFRDNELTVFGETKLGWVRLQLYPSSDTISKIIEYYLKKVNRIKTILEAAGKADE